MFHFTIRELVLLTLVVAMGAAAFVDTAHGQLFRPRFRRCVPVNQPAAPRFVRQEKDTAFSASSTAHDQLLKQSLKLLPDYTRCIVVSHQPALLDAKDIEQVERGEKLKEAIESLDPNPGMAFDRYLQGLSGIVLSHDALSTSFKVIAQERVQLAVCGLANYSKPAQGPAGATQADGVCIYQFDRSYSDAWRAMTQSRPRKSMFDLHYEGRVEFYQDGKYWFAFAPPNRMIVGNKYEYFHDVVKHAAGTNLKPAPDRKFVDLVDPRATFWFAYFANRTDADRSDWPVHVVEYAPNEEWLLTLWTGGAGARDRPQRGITPVSETFRSELIPKTQKAGGWVEPLVGEGHAYSGLFHELRFSVRGYDLESGAFPHLSRRPDGHRGVHLGLSPVF